MSALVCDICGGKLVMGSGGVAVCDSCGMEYSTERVREIVQSVKGTVQIDNSNMVDTWMDLANTAAAAGNQKEAYDYYAKVVEVEPSNWRAIFEKGKAAAWQSTLANSRTPELYQAITRALEIIEKSDMTSDRISNIKNEFAVALFNVNNAFLDLKKENLDKYNDKYFDLHWDMLFDAHYTQGSQNVKQTEDAMSLIQDLDDDLSKSNCLAMKKHICEVLQYICSSLDTYWDDYSQSCLKSFGLSQSMKKPFVDKYVQLVMEIRETEPEFRTSLYEQIDPWDPPSKWDSDRFNKLLSYWGKKDAELKESQKKALAQKRRTEYWKNHADEKKQLDARIKEIDSEIQIIYEQYSQYDIRIREVKKDLEQEIPSERQLIDIKQQQKDLADQKNKLGLFAGKQKGALQQKIDELQIQIDRIEHEVHCQKESIEIDVDERISVIKLEATPLLDKIEALQQEKEEINYELNKER